jgi:hypothetical protein
MATQTNSTMVPWLSLVSILPHKVMLRTSKLELGTMSRPSIVDVGSSRLVIFSGISVGVVGRGAHCTSSK